jgi:hypothetical protein
VPAQIPAYEAPARELAPAYRQVHGPLVHRTRSVSPLLEPIHPPHPIPRAAASVAPLRRYRPG